MIGDDMTGLLVVRSLDQDVGLAGLRAGYVIGDPTLIARHAAPAAAVVSLYPGARGHSRAA